MSPPLLQVDQLSRHFGAAGGRVLRAVDRVSLQVAEREVVGLVGESGSGKSTLGKTIVGLLEKTQGEVRYRGETLPGRYTSADFQRLSKRMQMIFQDPYSSLNPRMTVGEIIGEGLALHTQMTRDAISKRVQEWLARVGLHASHAGRYPHEFSGGQRQRIGIARALIMEPEFVVCDEPISALDVSVQAQIINLLLDLQDRLGLSMLFVAHDLGVVRHVSDRVAVMYVGRIVEVAPTVALYATPLHPYTRALLAAVPEPDPAVQRAKPRVPLAGEIPSPANPPPGCTFHTRCPLAIDICRHEVPHWRQVGHSMVACHRAEETP